jgi:hypothetical protein
MLIGVSGQKFKKGKVSKFLKLFKQWGTERSQPRLPSSIPDQPVFSQPRCLDIP